MKTENTHRWEKRAEQLRLAGTGAETETKALENDLAAMMGERETAVEIAAANAASVVYEQRYRQGRLAKEMRYLREFLHDEASPGAMASDVMLSRMVSASRDLADAARALEHGQKMVLGALQLLDAVEAAAGGAK